MAAADINRGVQENGFPTCGLVPKAETGVLNFLQKYPHFDGRDVTIAIFDSGVDPRAHGLETLCDGKTIKVIERYDCTGCGDVDVTKKVTADSKGYISGQSGRKLKLTPDMISSNIENGEFRIGLKNFWDLCPTKVRENSMGAAKLKSWDAPHKTAIAEVARKISSFESQNPESSKLSWEQKLHKENLDGTLDLLNSLEKYYNDVKIYYDCILYKTENGYQAVIDNTEEGDLENALHICEYSKTHEIKNVDDYLSISINVHDEGNVLEIVGMCSSHGTHVAAIASGNHSCKDVDGVAPNAKIVSLTIGDGRLGSMETGTALVRAMIKVMEMCRSGRPIDVINMSYGEHSHWSNSGRIGELMGEIVNKYGVVWVVSAGNHGPALSTIGTPPDLSQPCCIGVGAYVSPQMMESEYAMREKLPANVYTWTSRDPCIDGGQGVTICAPGGAITSVPQFTMCKSQLMNGTSMASPHVAGAIALLISGLKQKQIAYSPFSIKRALCATATHLSYVDPFAQGNGLLNVEKAFEYLVQHENACDNLIRFVVRCGPNNAKGIHVRRGFLQQPIECSVSIEPIFFNEKEAAPKDKCNFNVRLNLICSQPFVKCGQFLDLSYAPRSILLKIFPSGLQPGIHVATVRAFDSDCIEKGALFEIPIILVQPHVVNTEETRKFVPTSSRSDGSIEFQPNTIQRHFILVPNKATWAVLRIRCTDKNAEKDAGKFFIHTMQLLPKSSCRTLESMKFLSVNAESDSVWVFQCQDNNILELCIAKYWSNFGCTHIKYNLEFHGIRTVNPNACTMIAARGIHRIELSAFVSEDTMPQIQLKAAGVVLRPSDSKISPLSATRDIIPEGRQIYQNILTYTINMPRSFEVALYAPLFNELLYESEYESQLWMLYDSNKAAVNCGDAHSQKFLTKLERGEYTIKLQIRHERREALEKVSETNMIALLKLPNPILMDLYDNYNYSILGTKKFTTCYLKEIPTKVLFVNPLTQDKLTKANVPVFCSWLAGTLILPKDDVARKVDCQEFTYVLSPMDKKNGNGSNLNSASSSALSAAITSKIKSNSTTTTAATAGPSPATSSASGDGASAASTTGTSTSPKKSKSSADEYAESLRDFQCSMIAKCELEKAEKLHTEVIAAHPKHVLAHLMLIQNIESTELKAMYPLAFARWHKAASADEKQKEEIEKIYTNLDRVKELAAHIIQDIDKEALLSYIGLKNDTRVDAAKIKTNMDKQKSNLLEAYSKRGIAIAKQSVMGNNKKELLSELDSIYMEILKYTDATDAKVLQYSLWHAYVHEQYGRMFKFLQKLYEDKRIRDNYEELNMIAIALNYPHLHTVIDRMVISSYPNTYRLF